MDRLAGILWQSVKAVRAYRLRTFFCLTSVALGIAAITIIVAATEGAYKKAFDLVELFGPDALLVVGGSDESRAVGGREKTITLQDVDAVRDAFPMAYMVSPMTGIPNTSVSYKNLKTQTLIVGATADYSRAWSWPIAMGSDLTEDDLKGIRNVTVLGQKVVDELFRDESPVGKYIFVRSLPVQVVGVLSARGTTSTGQNMDDRIVLPLSTVMRKIQNETRYVSVFRIRFADQKKLDAYSEDIRRFMRERYRIPDGEPDSFSIVSPKEIIEFLVALTGSLVAFLGVVGVISLIVAGFVLANLFLLSIKERSREIGIRRSVGARRQDIRYQFLGEAVIITTLGGLFGCVLGVASSKLLTFVADFPMHFSWKAFAIGLLLSWIVGVAFGLQPASSAASLNPIEAIRE